VGVQDSVLEMCPFPFSKILILKGNKMCPFLPFPLDIPQVLCYDSLKEGRKGSRRGREVGIEEQRLKRIQPRHYEIMRRLCMGESQRDISERMGVNESRLSVVVNSPLFQLELRKMQRRMEDKVADITEGVITNAATAIERQRELLAGYLTYKGGEDGKEDVRITVGPNTVVAATSSSLNLFLKLTKGGVVEPEDGEESYEARLEKEVVLRETTTIRKPKKKLSKKEMEEELDSCLPSLDVADLDALDVVIDAQGGS
jgi:hypothetical protein